MKKEFGIHQSDHRLVTYENQPFFNIAFSGLNMDSFLGNQTKCFQVFIGGLLEFTFVHGKWGFLGVIYRCSTLAAFAPLGYGHMVNY